MSQEIVALLQQDMLGEHQAIVQYLLHAYAMGEVPLAFEVEAIARDEMRHLDWLADLVVELGGQPSMARAPVDLSPGAVSEQMLKDVHAEDVGIAQYRAHIEAIEHPSVRRVLSRILHDELVHQGQFVKFAAEAQAEGLQTAPLVEPATAIEKRRAAILNEGVRHEYTVTLQYLYHGFLAKDKDLAENMQTVAINEMQHIGWLAEALVGLGGAPDMNHTDLALTADPEQMLKADIAAERAVTKDYTEQLPELAEPKLQSLVARIRDHEVYHDATFVALLDEVEAAEHAAEPAPAACAEPAPVPTTPPPAPSIPSVGSLIARK